jgi:hypothetical protein
MMRMKNTEFLAASMFFILIGRAVFPKFGGFCRDALCLLTALDGAFSASTGCEVDALRAAGVVEVHAARRAVRRG